MTLEYTQGALSDLSDAMDWYEEQNPAVARRFAAETEKVVQRIVDTPRHFAKIDGQFRRALLSTFPYWIVFELKDGDVVLTAFAHTSRKPDYRRNR